MVLAMAHIALGRLSGTEEDITPSRMNKVMIESRATEVS
jgi:hypothetical protein